MQTISINLSRASSDIRTSIYPPIKLDPNKRHEMALIRLETYNSIPNVDENNNIIRYELNGETYDIVIPTGAYELSQINEVIQNRLIHPNAFEILANNNTLKSVIRINETGVIVHFNHENSMKDLLGFSVETVEGVGEHEGSSIVNILKVNSIFVNCDLVAGSFVNGSHEPVLYSFFPNVPPGYKVIETPGSPVYLPVSQNYIESIRLWLTDQDRNVINLRGETLTCWLVIRSLNV